MPSIQKRPTGKWRARYRDDTGREHSRHFPRKIDAQQWLDEVTASVVTGTYVDPRAGTVTFATFYRQWAARQVWVSGTVKAMDLAARSVTFGDLELARIRRSHIEEWVKAMDAAGLAPGTVRTRFNNVRGVFRAAAGDRVIATDPTIGVTLPRRRKPEHAMAIPTAEEVARALEAAEDWFRPFVGLCAFAGLRLGEAAAVQLGDVDFLRRTLSVRRQVQRAGGPLVEVRAPKYGSERVVALPDDLVTMLGRHVQTFGARPAGWLFVGGNGEPPHQNTVGHWWRTTARRARITGVTLHQLRHFYASGLIAEGCDVVTVQRALGHASATTTLNTYAHLWPSAEDRTRAAAARIMRAAADSLRTDART